jgi:hypothetical protein
MHTKKIRNNKDKKMKSVRLILVICLSMPFTQAANSFEFQNFAAQMRDCKERLAKTWNETSLEKKLLVGACVAIGIVSIYSLCKQSKPTIVVNADMNSGQAGKSVTLNDVENAAAIYRDLTKMIVAVFPKNATSNAL